MTRWTVAVGRIGRDHEVDPRRVLAEDGPGRAADRPRGRGRRPSRSGREK
ncbi:MAG: hypothetical protein MZV64_49555 [Ignavibacteriales bacterium]|nr:hypothetical protein [Ignavibacteriales bacterium]